MQVHFPPARVFCSYGIVRPNYLGNHVLGIVKIDGDLLANSYVERISPFGRDKAFVGSQRSQIPVRSNLELVLQVGVNCIGTEMVKRVVYILYSWVTIALGLSGRQTILGSEHFKHFGRVK